jgi:hypothetical protein
MKVSDLNPRDSYHYNKQRKLVSLTEMWTNEIRQIVYNVSNLFA